MTKLHLKKPSELKLEEPILIKSIHIGANSNDIGCFCPTCGAEIEFRGDWPIDIPIICSAIQDDNDVCKCRFIIKNDTPIEE